MEDSSEMGAHGSGDVWDSVHFLISSLVPYRVPPEETNLSDELAVLDDFLPSFECFDVICR